MPSEDRNGLSEIGPTDLRLIIGITVVMTIFSWFVAPPGSRFLVATTSGLISLVTTTMLFR